MSAKFSPSRRDLLLWFTGSLALVFLLYLWAGYNDSGKNSTDLFNQLVEKKIGAESQFAFYSVISLVLLGVFCVCFYPYLAGSKAKLRRNINKALSLMIHFEPHEILTAAAKINLRFSPEEAEVSKKIITLANKKRLAEAVSVCLFVLDISYQITRRESGVFKSLAERLVECRTDNDVDWLVDRVVANNYHLGRALMKAVREVRNQEAITDLLEILAEEEEREAELLEKKDPDRSQRFHRVSQVLG